MTCTNSQNGGGCVCTGDWNYNEDCIGAPLHRIQGSYMHESIKGAYKVESSFIRVKRFSKVYTYGLSMTNLKISIAIASYSLARPHPLA